MEEIHDLEFVITEEFDSYTGRKTKVLYIVLLKDNIIFLETVEVILLNNNSFAMKFSFENKNFIYNSKKTDNKVYTILNKFINKNSNTGAIRIVNVTSLMNIKTVSSLLCLEFFKENELKINNGVKYEF